MKDYWPEVVSLVRLLAYLVQLSDPDGIDIYYTITRETVKSKNSTDLIKLLSKTTLEGTSNIGLSLNNILGGYKRQLNSRYGAGTTAILSEDMKPPSLYVLTDGVWQDDCDAKTPILDLVKVLLRLERPKGQVGIQFIRFGHDAVGIQRLKELDDGINISGSATQLYVSINLPSAD